MNISVYVPQEARSRDPKFGSKVKVTESLNFFTANQVLDGHPNYWSTNWLPWKFHGNQFLFHDEIQMGQEIFCFWLHITLM